MCWFHLLLFDAWQQQLGHCLKREPDTGIVTQASNESLKRESDNGILILHQQVDSYYELRHCKPQTVKELLMHLINCFGGVCRLLCHSLRGRTQFQLFIKLHLCV